MMYALCVIWFLVKAFDVFLDYVLLHGVSAVHMVIGKRNVIHSKNYSCCWMKEVWHLTHNLNGWEIVMLYVAMLYKEVW